MTNTWKMLLFFIVISDELVKQFVIGFNTKVYYNNYYSGHKRITWKSMFFVEEFEIRNLRMVRNIPSTLLPFDTLILPVSPSWIKRVAEVYSKQWANSDTLPLDLPTLREASKIHVGYLSYDFNDHPTSHLMEGLFVHHTKSKISSFLISAFSFGKGTSISK